MSLFDSSKKPRKSLLRRWSVRLAIAALVLATAAVLLGIIYLEELERWQWQYEHWRTERSVERFGKGMPAVDEVRILHVEPLGSSPTLGTYTIPLYESTKMTIVAERTLHGNEAADLAALWRRQNLTVTHTGAACHDPHHVLQFRWKGSAVADVVICLTCGNVALPSFFSWKLVGFEEFPPPEESPQYVELKSTIEKSVGAHVPENLAKKAILK
jgi:hypothetical protein